MGKVNIPLSDHFIRKIGIALLILFVLIVISASIIGNQNGMRDAIFKATSIVTHANIEEAGTSGKYSLLLIGILGSVIQFYLIYVILEYILEGKINNILSEVRHMKSIKKLKGHHIICGGGRVGQHAAHEFKKHDKDFVMVEQNPELVKKLKAQGYLALHADSLEENDLLRAGVKKAKSLIAALDHDGDNILLVLSAKELNPNIVIAARASHEGIVKKLKHAGADKVILPEALGGAQLAHSFINEKEVFEQLHIPVEEGKCKKDDLDSLLPNL
jgi:voltage-gated potassium channel